MYLLYLCLVENGKLDKYLAISPALDEVYRKVNTNK